MTGELTEASIDTMARAWYAALDRHDELESVLGFLVDDGLEMRFPEGTSRGHEGFKEWYDAVTTRFFDEIHTVREVTVVSMSPEAAEVKVIVNWQARIHEGRAAQSSWLGFEAYQTWTVVPGDAGPQIQIYTVDKLDPMPGSAAL
jgi:ketosteroid isomerase-like protein